MILGIDPGYKHGCKCVVIDKHGIMIDKFKFMVEADFTLLNSKRSKRKTTNQNKKDKNLPDPKQQLEQCIKKNNVTVYI